MTLAELLVASFVMTIVLFGSYEVLRSGMSYFRSNQAAIDAQRGGLVLLSQLTSELENSCPNLIDLNAVSLYGIVFAGPLSPTTGVMSVDASGALYYQDYIAYYLQGTNIYRKADLIDPENVNPPAPEALTAPVGAWGTGKVIAYWPYSPSSPRLVAANIQQFFCQNVGGSQSVTATIYAGDNNLANLEGYWVKIQTSIYPRNLVVGGP
jgi:hypothetical protein